MDVHIVPGVKARDVAEAHSKDLLHQHDFGCKCMTYWIDEERENIFCLIEAPDKAAVEEMHRKAHGLVPHRVIEVKTQLVESFLGRIYDPEEAETTAEGLKVFSDPSFRVLVVIKTKDPVLLQHETGSEKTAELLKSYRETVLRNASRHQGREVEQAGSDCIISFTAASAALGCALEILNELPPANAALLDLKISLNAGEPVEKSNQLFGDTIQTARYMCMASRALQVAVSTSVRDLVAKDRLLSRNDRLLILSPQDQQLLEQLFASLEENWQDASFDVEDYCRTMAMSTSQLYRKCIALTGFSPNILLKEFRLEKAKELLKKKPYSIAQITFESGFTSPSYFTKCFKKKYGILPMAYLDMLHSS